MRELGRRGLVFVVDDEPAIAKTTALIVRGAGFEAIPFTDPQAALEAARADAPNLLFSDVIMPGMNGFELSTAVVKDCPRCKVLLFSGNPHARENYATTPAEKNWPILNKPMLPMDLLNAVRNQLEA
jgi:DNA-binding NtrC family response regulator